MTLQDLVITPLYLICIYLFAFILRDKITDKNTRRYFIPGLTLKLIGAIALGLIYQFYYDGGDTFNYFNNSKYIWEAFKDSPFKAFQLIFSDGTYAPSTFKYSSQMYFFKDPSSYFVIRVAGLFDIFTFHTYSATALLFACFSFSGLWAMYLSFYRFFPKLHFEMAIAVFFIPSVFFWGSGIMKDTLALGALSWAFYALTQLFFAHRNIVLNIFILLLASWMMYAIKIYILLCFLPAAILWLFLTWRKNVQSPILRIMLTPLMISLAAFLCYYAIVIVGEDNKRYSIETLSETAEITATYLYYISEIQGGSGYTLGDFDYSTWGIIKKLPLAINVTLFRPYLWEAKNVIMLLSALESLASLIFTLYVLFKTSFLFKLKKFHPLITFCLFFSLTFAFAIGFSTYNFGSLVRYKIPMAPFYLAGLFIINYLSNNSKKLSVLDKTE